MEIETKTVVSILLAVGLVGVALWFLISFLVTWMARKEKFRVRQLEKNRPTSVK